MVAIFLSNTLENLLIRSSLMTLLPCSTSLTKPSDTPSFFATCFKVMPDSSLDFLSSSPTLAIFSPQIFCRFCSSLFFHLLIVFSFFQQMLDHVIKLPVKIRFCDYSHYGTKDVFAPDFSDERFQFFICVIAAEDHDLNNAEGFSD